MSADAGTILLGDRTQIASMPIEDGQIVVDMVTQGSDDPMCCPTLKVHSSYVAEDGQLLLVDSEELGQVSLDDLMGTSWVLEEMDTDQPALTDTPVTAAFEDRLINGEAGCNTYSASVFSDGGQNLSIGPAAATRMACSQPIMDQEAQYLAALEGSVQWSYYVGKLAITYQTKDGGLGRLVFGK